MTHQRDVILPSAPRPRSGPTHAVRAAGLLFCSGQIPLDPESGELVGDEPAAQAERCLENLSVVCAAAGASLAEAVRVTVYLTDMSAFAASTRSTSGISRPSRRLGLEIRRRPR